MCRVVCRRVSCVVSSCLVVCRRRTPHTRRTSSLISSLASPHTSSHLTSHFTSHLTSLHTSLHTSSHFASPLASSHLPHYSPRRTLRHTPRRASPRRVVVSHTRFAPRRTRLVVVPRASSCLVSSPRRVSSCRTTPHTSSCVAPRLVCHPSSSSCRATRLVVPPLVVVVSCLATRHGRGA